MKRFYILFLLPLFFLSISSKATHMLGGEITWQCINSGPDQGKFVFVVKLYRACPGVQLSSSATVNNPLAVNYGGPGTITATRVAQNDLSRPCFNPNYQSNCYNPALNNSAVEEHIYRSSPVQLNGIPDSSGSDFWFSTCCRPASSLMRNINGTLYWLRATMFPFRQNPSSSPRPLGSASLGPKCYDSSPEFAARPTILICERQMVNYQHHAFDMNGDSISYEWSAPMQSDSSSIAWKTDYSDTLQLPNKAHDTLNIDPVLDRRTGMINFYTNSHPIPGGYHSIAVKTTTYRHGQKLAEVIRDLVVVITDCDTISSSPPVYNLTSPNVEFKPVGAPSYSSYLNLVKPVGSLIELDIMSVDSGLLPTNPLSKQSVTLEVLGVSMSDRANLNGPCLIPPCAYIDSNLSTWKDSMIMDTTSALARFRWQTSCDNLENISNYNGSIPFQEFVFMVKAYDNWCPIPSENFGFFTITLMDTSIGWPFDSIDSRNGAVELHWPMYTGTGFVSYEIYRSTNMSSGTPIASISSPATTSYLDVSASDDIPYYYLIRINSGPGCEVGYQQRNVNVDLNQLGNTVNLNWNHPHAIPWVLNQGKYFIHRKIGTGAWSIIDSANYGFEFYSDNSAPPNQLLSYYISSKDVYNYWTYSDIDTITIDTSRMTPPPVGINEEMKLNAWIYPNPAVDILNIELESNADNVNLRLYSSQGREVLKTNLNQTRTSLNISMLKPGIYFVELVADNAVLRKKILISVD